MSPGDNAPLPTTSGAALRVHLTYLRSQQLVAAALAKYAPTEEEWLAFLSNDVVNATFEQFAAFVNEIRSMVDAGAVIDFDELVAIGAQHLNTGLEAVEDLAALLDVHPNDLLATLLYG